MGVATDARSKAEQAMSSANNPAGNLTHEDVFNLLTDNGALQGIYRGDDGEIYINASYLKSGIIDASLIKSGILQSADGSIQLDLSTGALVGKTPGGNTVFLLQKNSSGTGSFLRLFSSDQTKKIELDISDTMASIGFSYNGSTKIHMWYIPSADESQLQIERISTDVINGKTISWKSNGDGTYTLIGT